MGSISSQSPGSSAGKGGSWTHKIYFDQDADIIDKQQGYDPLITNEILREKLGRLVNNSEEIVKIILYKHPLHNWQLTSFMMYHLFVVFETNYWWWSVEKNSEGITIQRSHNLYTVRDKHRQTKRVPGVVIVKVDEAKKSVKDLIEWLYHEDELNKTYHFYSSNCQVFANRVYDHVHGQRSSEPF